MMTEPGSDLQQELLSLLSHYIDAGSISIIRGDRAVFDHLTASFPITAFGVNWDRLPYYRHQLSAQPKAPASMRDRLAVSFLQQVALDAGIDLRDHVVVVGDGVTDITLEMPFSVLLDTIGYLIAIPQHTYVVAKDYEWCFCYTFEDDMHFGRKRPVQND